MVGVVAAAVSVDAGAYGSSNACRENLDQLPVGAEAVAAGL